MKVRVTTAGGHNAIVNSVWTLRRADVHETRVTGFAPLTIQGSTCFVPVECIAVASTGEPLREWFDRNPEVS